MRRPALGRAGWASVAAAAVGLVAGLLTPPRADVAAGELPDAGWNLPPAASLLRHDAAEAAAASRLRWQGAARAPRGKAGAAGQAPAEETWALRGIVLDPEPTALVQVGQGRLLRLRVGDALPDGHPVTGLDDDTLRWEQDGCERRLRLHHPAPPPDAGCPAAAETPPSGDQP